MAPASSPSINRRRLLQARVEAGLSQEELATDVGCSVYAIGKLERGETKRPRPQLMRAIAARLGRDVIWFYERDGAGVAA